MPNVMLPLENTMLTTCHPIIFCHEQCGYGCQRSHLCCYIEERQHSWYGEGEITCRRVGRGEIACLRASWGFTVGGVGMLHCHDVAMWGLLCKRSTNNNDPDASWYNSFLVNNEREWMTCRWHSHAMPYRLWCVCCEKYEKKLYISYKKITCYHPVWIRNTPHR
jgi:hypothetical protein